MSQACPHDDEYYYGEQDGYGGDESVDSMEHWREEGGYAGAFDAFEGAEFYRRGGDHRARVARADDGFGVTAFDEVDGAAERGIFFAAHGKHRMVTHFDDFSRMDDFNARVVAAVPVEFVLEERLVARKEELGDLLRLGQRRDRAGDYVLRRVVTTHSIKSDFHNSIFCFSQSHRNTEPHRVFLLCGTL